MLALQASALSLAHPTPAYQVRRASCIACGEVEMIGSNAVIRVESMLKGERASKLYIVSEPFLPQSDFASLVDKTVIVFGTRTNNSVRISGPWDIWPDGAKNPRWDVPIQSFDNAKQTVQSFLQIFSVAEDETAFADVELDTFGNPASRWISIEAAVDIATNSSQGKSRQIARKILSILAAKSLSLRQLSDAEYHAFISGTSLLPPSIALRLLQRCADSSSAFAKLARSKIYYGFVRKSPSAPLLSDEWAFVPDEIAGPINAWKLHDAQDAISLFDDPVPAIRNNAAFVLAAILGMENNGNEFTETKSEWETLVQRLLEPNVSAE